MNKCGKLWIIPDEDKILQEIYEQDVQKDKTHTYYIQEFSNIYQLGFDFKEEDYQSAPCEITTLGHLVIKSEDEVSLIVCYLPERITDRQYNWLYQNRELFDKYIQVNGYSLQTVDDDGTCWKKVHGMEEIMIEVRRKNMIEAKGKGM